MLIVKGFLLVFEILKNPILRQNVSQIKEVSEIQILKSFYRSFENDTFERVILESVQI